MQYRATEGSVWLWRELSGPGTLKCPIQHLLFRPQYIFLASQVTLKTRLHSQSIYFFEHSVNYLTIFTEIFRVPARRLQTVSSSNVRLRVVARVYIFFNLLHSLIKISSQKQNNVFILLGYEAKSLKYWWPTFSVLYPMDNKCLLRVILVFEIMWRNGKILISE